MEPVILRQLRKPVYLVLAMTLLPCTLLAKECTVGSIAMSLTNASGTGVRILLPATGTYTDVDFGTIQVTAGAKLTLWVIHGGQGHIDCTASVYRDGESMSPTIVGPFYHRSYDVSAVGNYTGGATGGHMFHFSVVDAGTAPVEHQLSLSCQIEGAQVPGSSATNMRTDLAQQQLVPCTEPYTSMGYPPPSTSTETVSNCTAALQQHQVVDWVHVEVLSANQPTTVIAAMNGLLTQGGNVVSPNAYGPLIFTAPPGLYRIHVVHRNHLAVTTDQPIVMLGGPISLPVNTSVTQVALFASYVYSPTCKGTTPCILHLGNTNSDQKVSYVGPNNDRDPILVRIGGSVPTNIASGYYLEDVNMDGVVRYVGANNDRDPILQMIGGSVPTNVVLGQTP